MKKQGNMTSPDVLSSSMTEFNGGEMADKQFKSPNLKMISDFVQCSFSSL
jgi:hypothetical protein